MTTNTFTVAEQKDNVGYYAAVTLSIDIVDGVTGFSIRRGNDVDDRWLTAVEFGVSYGFEQLPRTMTDGKCFRIIVDAVNWAPADSSLTVVALASAQCLWSALGFLPAHAPGVNLDAAGIFFPKRAI